MKSTNKNYFKKVFNLTVLICLMFSTPRTIYASEIFSLGFINVDNKIYLESTIKLPKNVMFDIYTYRGYEGTFKFKSYTSFTNGGTGIDYSYIKLDKEISGIAPSRYYGIPGNLVVAIKQSKSHQMPTGKELKVEKKPKDYKQKAILRALKKNGIDMTGEWDMNVFEGSIDESGRPKLVIDASIKYKDSSKIGSYIFVLGSEGREKKIIDVIPLTYSSGDSSIYWELDFCADIDNDGFAEFVIKNFPYDGQSSSVYKWNGKEYKEIYESFYFGG